MSDLVTLDEVAAELRWTADSKEKYATIMGSYIAAATPVIESIAGPVLPRTVIETHDGGPSVALHNRPVSVASVAVNGSVVSGWVVKGDLIIGPFARGVQNVTVVYQVGVVSVPDNVKRATIALIAYNWRRLNPQQTISEEVIGVPQEYAIPAATYQWLRPQQALIPAGFA